MIHGLSRADIAEIKRVVHAATSEEILSYRMLSDGAVDVEVRNDAYLVERVKGKWQINRKKVVVES